MKVIGIKGELLIDPEMEITPNGLEDVPGDQFVVEYLKTIGNFKYVLLGNGLAKNGIWEVDFERTNLAVKA